MKYYFAYGSNLNKEQMKMRCPSATVRGSSVIEDYMLVFRRGVLTIEPSKGDCVPVGIWKITDDDERRLDVYEGYPKWYHKEEFKILIIGQPHELVSGMAYVMNEGHPIRMASRAYLRTVRDGYRDFGFRLDGLIDADLDAYDLGGGW